MESFDLVGKDSKTETTGREDETVDLSLESVDEDDVIPPSQD
jgi:hypothetical protein